MALVAGRFLFSVSSGGHDSFLMGGMTLAAGLFRLGLRVSCGGHKSCCWAVSFRVSCGGHGSCCWLVPFFRFLLAGMTLAASRFLSGFLVAGMALAAARFLLGNLVGGMTLAAGRFWRAWFLLLAGSF